MLCPTRALITYARPEGGPGTSTCPNTFNEHSTSQPDRSSVTSTPFPSIHYRWATDCSWQESLLVITVLVYVAEAGSWCFGLGDSSTRPAVGLELVWGRAGDRRTCLQVLQAPVCLRRPRKDASQICLMWWDREVLCSCSSVEAEPSCHDATKNLSLSVNEGLCTYIECIS